MKHPGRGAQTGVRSLHRRADIGDELRTQLSMQECQVNRRIVHPHLTEIEQPDELAVGADDQVLDPEVPMAEGVVSRESAWTSSGVSGVPMTRRSRIAVGRPLTSSITVDPSGTGTP